MSPLNKIDYDAWLTNDPDDKEWCHEHGYAVPCGACQADEMDRRYDERREP